jgi:hypothetical protein
MAGAADVRGALQRRFTTNTVPTLSPIGQQRRQAAGDVQMVSPFDVGECRFSGRQASDKLEYWMVNVLEDCGQSKTGCPSRENRGSFGLEAERSSSLLLVMLCLTEVMGRWTNLKRPLGKLLYTC